MEEGEEEEEYLISLEDMPTNRLKDVVKILQNKKPEVVNIDAIVPPKEDGEDILRTLLRLIPSTTKCFSMRFNNLSLKSIDEVINWIQKNDYIEALYIMGCGIDDKNRERLEASWRKNMAGHRTENMGYTFIRVPLAVRDAFLLAEATG